MLTFPTISGVLVAIEDSALLVFVDETGHEHLADPSYRIFGWGGCAIRGSGYREAIVKPWDAMRGVHFSELGDKPFHTTEIQFSTAQMEALGRFFGAQRFYRLAVILTDKTALDPGLSILEASAPFLMDTIRDIALREDPSSVVVLFEHSARLSASALRHFRPFGIRRTTRLGATEVPVSYILLGKSVREPGLEVADVVVHTAGTQSNQRADAERWLNHRDFKAVFGGKNEDLAYFRYANRAVREHPAVTP